tara:strand:- start:23 stop:1411 length:1389 start_codon:yes stop_codon:yes gene_type:complete
MRYDTIHIKQIEILEQILKGLKPLKDLDKKRLDKKMRLEFNYNSNHIEGNTLTYGQTEMLLFSDLSVGDVSVSDLEEMKGHDLGLKMINDYALDKDRPLTELFIKELNKIILVRPYWKEAVTNDSTPTSKRIIPGEYKKMPNHVRLKNGEVFEYTNPEDVVAEMSSLIQWYRENKETMHPVQIAAEFHYKFVCIHPFDDGNGRVARLIMNYILISNDYPLVVIKSDDKSNYLKSLRKADLGYIKSIIEYIEFQMIWSLELNIAAANGEAIEESEDYLKELELLKKEKLSIEYIHKTPKILFELIEFTRDYIFLELNSKLEAFDDFFAEIKQDTYLDHIKYIKTKTVSKLPMNLWLDKEEEIRPYKIYNIDLEEEALENLQYKFSLLSLKSSSEKYDVYLFLELKLNDSNYDLNLYFSEHDRYNKEELINTTQNYGRFLLKAEIDIYIKSAIDKLMNSIKVRN